MKTGKQTHTPMTVMESDCGCKWTGTGDDVEYCSVHAAAQELLAECKKVLVVLDNYASLGPYDFIRTRASLRRLLAKVGGR